MAARKATNSRTVIPAGAVPPVDDTSADTQIAQLSESLKSVVEQYNDAAIRIGVLEQMLRERDTEIVNLRSMVSKVNIHQQQGI